ncbi:MAG: hypothetical protein JWO31_2612 [Phycisphaerales bacterium]|nr:hypothetical protein [Phycisphaerales bacterium]
MPPATRSGSPSVVSAADAARLLLGRQGLLDDPAAAAGPATPRRVARLVERIGFVQVDAISTVERAHHLILAARLAGYRPAMLASALEVDRSLFEHWTHDASVLPLAWYPHWHFRFDRYRASRWHLNQLGAEADRVVAAVLDRVRREGPLSSRDFAAEVGAGPAKTTWWQWRPPKVALEYLWRTGALHVVARRHFHKVYDLTERAVPAAAAVPRPTEVEHVDWACRTALDRLGTATARELVQFWAAVTPAQVKVWLTAAVASGEVVPVSVGSADESPPVLAYAPHDYRRRLARLPAPPPGVRMLCPFDPVLRDRARAKRLFGFDFRFEGFVPAAARRHGYYVMAVLDGDRFVGRADPKVDRRSGVLTVRKVWWEPGVRPTRKARAALEAGAEQLAAWVGATAVRVEDWGT